MDFGLLFLLLGVGALFVFGDFFNSSNSDDDNEDETASSEGEDETGSAVRVGTQGDDLLISAGGEVLEGLGGNDTLITYGDSTLLGGEGDDTLVSVGGGALLTGGEGEDTFRIDLLGVDDDGALLDVNGQPVAPTVIDYFNPDEDRLVLDLRQSALLPGNEDPVILTGVLAPDGDGLMVQVDGVNVVQLSGYGDEDMQEALEVLDIEVLGAEFVFPEGLVEEPLQDEPLPDEMPTDTSLPAGVGIHTDEDGNTVFVFNESYSGGGVISGGAGLNVVDLSALRFDVEVIVNDDGSATLGFADPELPRTMVTGVTSFILGGGDDLFDARGANGPVFVNDELETPRIQVIAAEGFNVIYGGPGENILVATGGDNTLVGGEGFNRFFAGAGNDEIIAGAGPNVIDAFGLQNFGTSQMPVLLGPTDVQGSPGDDFIRAGLGDQMTGGGGSNTFEILGAGPEGAGPAIIFDFDRGVDRLFYLSVLETDSDTPGDITLVDTNEGVTLLEDGEVMLLVVGVTADDLASMSDADFRTSGAIRLDLDAIAA